MAIDLENGYTPQVNEINTRLNVATLLLQGLLSNPAITTQISSLGKDRFCEIALEYADAIMLKEAETSDE